MADPAPPTTNALITTTWGTFVHNRVAPLQYRTFLKTSDGSGLFSITAAEFGMSSIDGVIAGIQWSATGTPSRVEARLMAGSAVSGGGSSIQCIVYNAAGGVVASAAVCVWVVAWGVGA